jgi:alpha-ketoglutarate-dependent taurine dioxygenase
MRQTLAATPQARRTVVNLVIDSANRQIVIRWADGHESRFHWVWLRHQCFYAATGNESDGKTLDLPDDPGELRIQEVAVDGGDLQIDWANDGRRTRHGLAWLRSRCYAKAARPARKHKPILWDRERAETLPWLSYADLKHDAAVFRLLASVRDYGFARVLDVPALSGVVDQVARHFGQANKAFRDRAADPRTSAGGEAGPNRLAAVQPRTEQSYRHYPPGVSLYHCLKAAGSAGGEAVLIDGFMVAERLLEADPDAFEILCDTPLPFEGDDAADEGLRTWARVICVDGDGELAGIRYCAPALAPLDLPDDRIEAAYRALRAFARQLRAEDLPLRYRMRPGDLHVVDNHRVLHGRAAAAGGALQLRHSAVSRDEFTQRYRALAARFSPEDADLILSVGALG